MLRYGPDGKAVAWSPPARGWRSRSSSAARLDARRTWRVRALLTIPGAAAMIFIDEPLAILLLKEAALEREEPTHRPRRAAPSPTDSQAHDDHMHLRVFCDIGDRRLVRGRGPVHW